MAIYDVGKAELYESRSVNGSETSNAYDVSGNVVFTKSGSINLRVMSYNIQWFTNLNADVDVQDEAFVTQAPDIVGLQEVSQESGYPSIDGLPANIYLNRKGFSYVNMVTSMANKVALASKYPVTDFREIAYTNYGSQLRSYLKCYISIGGKRIAFYNTHLDPYHGETEIAIRASQAQQLLADIATEDTFILTGDFNTDLCFDVSGVDYINVIKPMIDAGYNVANANPNRDGFMPTWSSSSDFSSGLYVLDNIITSSDITMVDVWRDMYKVNNNTTDYAIDHVPILADLTITL